MNYNRSIDIDGWGQKWSRTDQTFEMDQVKTELKQIKHKDGWDQNWSRTDQVVELKTELEQI